MDRKSAAWAAPRRRPRPGEAGRGLTSSRELRQRQAYRSGNILSRPASLLEERRPATLAFDRLEGLRGDRLEVDLDILAPREDERRGLARPAEHRDAAGRGDEIVRHRLEELEAAILENLRHDLRALRRQRGRGVRREFLFGRLERLMGRRAFAEDPLDGRLEILPPRRELAPRGLQDREVAPRPGDRPPPANEGDAQGRFPALDSGHEDRAHFARTAGMGPAAGGAVEVGDAHDADL